MDRSPVTSGTPARVSREAWLILTLLTIAMGISYVDRFVLAMLIQPVKAELDLSDTEIGIAIFFMAMPVGAMWATVQDVAPEEHRATGSAVTMMMGFVIGQGVGPFAIGLASDLLLDAYGVLSLRYALIICVSSAAALLLIPLYIMGAHTHRDGRETLRADV